MDVDLWIFIVLGLFRNHDICQLNVYMCFFFVKNYFGILIVALRVYMYVDIYIL